MPTTGWTYNQHPLWPSWRREGVLTSPHPPLSCPWTNTYLLHDKVYYYKKARPDRTTYYYSHLYYDYKLGRQMYHSNYLSYQYVKNYVLTPYLRRKKQILAGNNDISNEYEDRIKLFWRREKEVTSDSSYNIRPIDRCTNLFPTTRGSNNKNNNNARQRPSYGRHN